MKNLIFLLIAFTSLSSNAQNENALLWEISGNGLTEPSYVMGTIHMIPKKDFFLTNDMKTAMDKSEVLVVEADMFSISLSEKLEAAMEAMLPSGETLKDHMDSLDYMVLKQFVVDSLGIKEKTFEKRYARIKPFFLTGVLLQDYVGKVKTYEQELYDVSKKQKMEIKALETIAFQMGLANGMSMEEQLDGVAEMKQFEMYYDMVELYKQQAIYALQDLAMQEYDEMEDHDFAKRFVDDRNMDWIPKIATMAKDNSCFIAVGALHLPGENGVLSLLKKEGYQVKALGLN